MLPRNIKESVGEGIIAVLQKNNCFTSSLPFRNEVLCFHLELHLPPMASATSFSAGNNLYWKRDGILPGFAPTTGSLVPKDDSRSAWWLQLFICCRLFTAESADLGIWMLRLEKPNTQTYSSTDPIPSLLPEIR